MFDNCGESKRCLPHSSVKHEMLRKKRIVLRSCPRVTSSPLTNFKLPSENRHNMLISQYEQPLEREKVLANVESKEIQDKPNWHTSKEKSILKEGERKSTKYNPIKYSETKKRWKQKQSVWTPRIIRAAKRQRYRASIHKGMEKEVPPAMLNL